MCIYLYVKTHTKTGLKYLGKTKRNPYTYSGSGIDWKQHLKEHGSEGVETRVLIECQTNEQINVDSLEFLTKPAMKLFIINSKTQLFTATVKIITINVDIYSWHIYLLSLRQPRRVLPD